TIDRVAGRVDAGHEVADQAAMALQRVRDHAIRGRRSVDVESVAAQTADDGGGEVRACALHEEAIVALGAVDLERFDVDEVHEQAGAEYAVSRYDEVVVELGADDDDVVEAVAAVDIDRRIDGVLDEVGARAAAYVGARALVVLRAGQGEGLDDEGVVAGVA